jgi:hypothetical protein
MEEHLMRAGRAVAGAQEGFAEGGEVEEAPPNPYSSLPPESQVRQAYNTSLDRWKDVLLAPAEIPMAPPWEQAMGLIGGLGSKGPGRWWPRVQTGKSAYSKWTPEEDAALAKWIKGDETVIPQELAHRSETALQSRALSQGYREPAVRYKRAASDVAKPPAPQPDYLDLAYEPRQALLTIERAAQEGSLHAKAIMNQYVQTAPTKRDALLQTYIDKLKRAGWKAGMKRGGAVRRNPYATAA